VRHLGEQGAQADHQFGVVLLGERQQLAHEAAPAHGRLDPVDQDHVAIHPGGRRDQDRGGRPRHSAYAGVLLDGHPRPVHLEVVIVLGVQGGDRLGVPGVHQVGDQCRGGLGGVVPTLEGGQHDGAAQRRYVVEVDHRTSLRRRRPWAREEA